MNIYEANEIHSKLYILGERVNDFMVNAMMLVIGDKKAALIDTGMGATGDLDRFVKKFTDLPVMILNTHGDPDHIGADLLFGEVYMSKRDNDLLPWAVSMETRLNMAAVVSEKLYEYARTHSVGSKLFPYQDIKNGGMFDLGGVFLEAVSVPGHTKGCMGFMNRDEQYAFLGDSINPIEWMWLDRCEPVAVYLESLKRLKKTAKGIKTFYCGHLMEPVPKNTIDELIMACEDIIAGNTANDEPYSEMIVEDIAKDSAMQHSHGKVTVIYNREKIY